MKMDKLIDTDSRFRGLEIKIGVLVALALAGIIVIIVFIGVQKDIFTHKYRIFFTSESGAGFKEGMPVKLSGFKIGRIKTIELTDAAHVKVTIEINKKYEKWVRSTSEARIGKEGLIGDAFIEIALGAPGGSVLADGDEIRYYKTGGMEALVEEVKPILNEIKGIIHYVNDPKGDLRASISNIREFTAELKDTRAGIDKLITNLDARTGPVLSSAAITVKNLESVSQGLAPVATKLNVILDKTVDSADKLNSGLQSFKTFTGALAKEAPRIEGVVTNAQEAAAEGKVLIKGVREGWVGSLTAPSPPERPRLVPLDGYPAGPPVSEAGAGTGVGK